VLSPGAPVLRGSGPSAKAKRITGTDRIAAHFAAKIFLDCIMKLVSPQYRLETAGLAALETYDTGDFQSFTSGRAIDVF
jgi:hypothetical protein